MKSLFYLLFLVALLQSCASVEPATQSEEDTTVEEESVAPGWYNPMVKAVSDSANVYGFALASATDSSEAILLSQNTAINNLRHEIDYLTETTRKWMVENSSSAHYTRSSFIIELRNTVRDLPLSSASIEFESRKTESDIYYIYAKASLPKSSLWNIISDRINDSEFLDAFKSIPAD